MCLTLTGQSLIMWVRFLCVVCRFQCAWNEDGRLSLEEKAYIEKVKITISWYFESEIMGKEGWTPVVGSDVEASIAAVNEIPWFQDEILCDGVDDSCPLHHLSGEAGVNHVGWTL